MLNIEINKISLLTLSKVKPFWLFFVIVCFAGAKSTPTFAQTRAIAIKRAASLDNGISISWLEQTWNADALKQRPVADSDFKLLKKLGFKSIRLPVAFKYYESKHISIITVIKSIDYVWNLCNRHGFKLVIDYHYGNLNDTNYVAETRSIINTWSILTRKYAKASPDKLFFEIYNEPPPMSPQVWKDAAYNIVTALRKIDAKRTFLVGASNYNSIYELSRMVRLGDENIIYTCHFYEPFFFTHQGASWVGNQVSTTGVPFPYTVENFPAINPKAKNTWGETNYNQYKTDGNERSVKDKLQIVKNWAGTYGVPVICSEYGVYNKYADLDSRCRYIKAVRSVLKELHIPGMLWEYNGNFSLFSGKPTIKNLPVCMANAIGYEPKK
ncbi:glycoside hydrolase family 5 protein [Mucilaginibacter terrae]|uniref:Endoglucanase n=1 Tax=Mucilaginibacter terrae TaxID=1955052 RepID=A0ABU3GUD2_9SPHI|nr:cellulase family glycosylhydrolase [Mucilaginibacter terrae]MDT3403181.1 endoglucanase [Mucilaginibacter terrae]